MNHLKILPCLWLLAATVCCAQQSAAPMEVHVSTGQQLADAVAFWQQHGGQLLILLGEAYISVQNASLTPTATDGGAANVSFLPGQLTYLGSGADKAALDAGMNPGLYPKSTGAQILLENVSLINSCVVQSQLSKSLGSDGFVVGAFRAWTRLYQSLICKRCILYVGPAELSREIYLKTMQRTTFPPVKAILSPLFEDFPQVVQTVTSISEYAAKIKNMQTPAAVVIHGVVKSTSDPDDPLLQRMRSRGLLMAPQFCNGTLLPPEPVDATIDPIAPAWVVQNSTALLTALTEAAQFTRRPGVKWRPPPELVLTGNLTMSTTTAQNFQGFVCITGPFNDDPEYQLTVHLDLQRANNTLQLGPGAQLFIQQLTLTGLAQGPLPTSPSTSSAFPLAAVTPPPGTDPVAGVPYVWLHNVTLVLPPEDYLAVTLASTPDDISRCLEADVAAHAAQLQPGIHSVAVTASAADRQWLELSSMLGWGLNATSLRLVPSSPVPGFSGCVPAQPSSRCGSVTCGQLAGIVAGSVCGLCILLGALLLWLKPKAAHRSQLKHQGEGPASVADGKDMASRLAMLLDTIKSDGMADGAMLVVPSPTILAVNSNEVHSATDKSLHDLVKQKASVIGTGRERVVVTGVLGSGSFGTVYSGVWRGLDVAVKTVVFEEHGEESRTCNTRAIMEAAIAASVGHQNVVCTYHYDIISACTSETHEAGGLEIIMSSGCQEQIQAHHGLTYKLYLIQELCQLPLGWAVKKGLLLNPVTKTTDWEAVVSILLGIANGLVYLHSKSIVHGDLKPANILLKMNTSEATTRVDAKLTDFGLSTHLGGNATHVSNFHAGTPFYIAPEVAFQGHASRAADIYSLGVILWQFVANAEPFIRRGDAIGRNPMFPTLPLDTPAQIARLTHRCLKSTPQHRPSAEEVASILKQFQMNLSSRTSDSICTL